jgi:hypothetical protein
MADYVLGLCGHFGGSRLNLHLANQGFRAVITKKRKILLSADLSHPLVPQLGFLFGFIPSQAFHVPSWNRDLAVFPA